ncbi:MAG TPA: DegV family protein [Feifaniaceae bacterium]|nr:DegV family protein [Feifaniaceae bacterium]
MVLLGQQKSLPEQTEPACKKEVAVMNRESAYVLFTDTSADMPWGSAKQQQIELAHLHYKMDGTAYAYSLGRETDLSAFYFAMRNGAEVSTIPVLPEAFVSLWEPHLISGRDILMLTLSKHLSRTFVAAQHAREELLAHYPKRRIVVADTLCCAAAQGMLVFEAAFMRQEGKSLDEVAKWVVENRRYVNALLLPQDTRWLRAGGFYEGGAIGELMGRRVILRMDADGLLAPEKKARSEEDALNFLVDATERLGYALNKQVVGVTHADAPELAKSVSELLLEAGCADTAILPMGPICGSYAGPGAVGVAFFGGSRH